MHGALCASPACMYDGRRLPARQRGHGAASRGGAGRPGVSVERGGRGGAPRSGPRGRTPPRGRGRARAGAGAYRQSAQQRLRRFRQGSILAVAFTGLFLLVWGVGEEVPAQDTIRAAEIVVDTVRADTVTGADTAPADPVRAVEEATGTIRQLAVDFTAALPKVLIALALLAAAALLVRVVRYLLRHALGQWERAEATTAMAGVLIWLLAVGAALSVVAGDARALVGSVGLLGLALSWALQAPIESFAGWLFNSFKGYYRVGDRIAVGEVVGDVYRIDFLNTTVWGIGGPDKPVQGAQPTGGLITFPNSEVLRANIVNFTRDFPYVWDEVSIGITYDSDLAYALRVVSDTARRVIGPDMAAPVDRYRALLEREGLGFDIADEPQVFVSQTDSWMDLTVRYLVNARERRRWSSTLVYEINVELAKPEHRERLRPGVPVTRLELPESWERRRDDT
jgi:small conductance mechanosensitive channel